MPPIRTVSNRPSRNANTSVGASTNPSQPADMASTSQNNAQKRTRSKRRDFGRDVEEEFDKTPEQEEAARLRFSSHIFRILAPSTERRITMMKECWAKYYAKRHGITEEEAIQRTLSKDSPVPSVEDVRRFLFILSSKGRSALVQGEKGWARSTTETHYHAFLILRHRVQAIRHDWKWNNEVKALISQMCDNKELKTVKRQNPVMRLEDLSDLLGTVWMRKTFQNVLSAPKYSAAFGILAGTGLRPGSLLLADDYHGTNECMTWGDSTLLISGFDNGPQFDLFLVARWAKNMRKNDGANVHSHLRSLSPELGYLDPIIDFIILGHELGIPVKEAFRDKAIFLNSKESGPMTTAAARRVFSDVSYHLNWAVHHMYVMRRSYATQAASRSKVQDLSEHREMDNSGIMFDGKEKLEVIKLIRSISAGHHLGDELSAHEADCMVDMLTSHSYKDALELACSWLAMGGTGAATHSEEHLTEEYENLKGDLRLFLQFAISHYNPVGALAAPGYAKTCTRPGELAKIREAFSSFMLEIRNETISRNSGDTENDRALQAAGSQAIDHPFANVCIKYPNNPMLSVLEAKMLVLETRKQKKQGICEFCIMQSKKTPENILVAGAGRHTYLCENAFRSPDEERCNACFQFIPSETLPPIPSGPTCRSHIRKVGAVQAWAVEYEWSDKKQAAPMNLIFCPICLHDHSLDWNERHKVYFTETEFYIHTKSHYSAIRCNSNPTGLAHMQTHVCDIEPCDGHPFVTHEYVTHLHNFHLLNLVQCLRGCTSHTALCFDLPPEFRFHGQALEEAKYPSLGRPMPAVCLRDTRKASEKKTWNARLLKAMGGTIAGDESGVDSQDERNTATGTSKNDACPTPPPGRDKPYDLERFGAEFRIPQPLIANLADVGFDLFSDLALALDYSEWDEFGFVKAAKVSFLRKLKHIRKMNEEGRFTNTSYTPPDSPFLEIPLCYTLQDFCTDYDIVPLQKRLEEMHYILDDPIGMQSITDTDWKAYGFSIFERKILCSKHDALTEQVLKGSKVFNTANKA
ncbi:hypothetical protein NMY22_g4637 [Coprinellus aureogranulatus]|nr:hypothetical protein NMY22_g4637 [Coprinellus aureogranulatus]